MWVCTPFPLMLSLTAFCLPGGRDGMRTNSEPVHIRFTVYYAQITLIQCTSVTKLFASSFLRRREGGIWLKLAWWSQKWRERENAHGCVHTNSPPQGEILLRYSYPTDGRDGGAEGALQTKGNTDEISVLFVRMTWDWEVLIPELHGWYGNLTV